MRRVNVWDLQTDSPRPPEGAGFWSSANPFLFMPVLFILGALIAPPRYVPAAAVSAGAPPASAATASNAPPAAAARDPAAEVSAAEVPAASSASSASDLEAQMDSLLAPAYPADGPGAAVIVVRDGVTIFRKGYGLANVELGVPIRPEMSFRLGSITKQFTAAAILVLAEQGRLSLDDEITRFLPDYPKKSGKITIRHLLTHTSGVANYTDLAGFELHQREDYTREQLIDSFRNEPLLFAPGTRFEYDNSGYVLLGAIIEKTSGATYERFLKEKIFDPLGMSHTGDVRNETIFPGRVCGYAKKNGVLTHAEYVSMTQHLAAGSLVSSVDDLAKWDAALYTDKLLKPGSIQQMFTPYRLANGESTGYGLGWAITDEAGIVFQEHGGGINGFLTSVTRVPSRHVYVALLGNSTSPELPPEFLARHLAGLAVGRPYVRRVAIHLDPAVVETYVGTYRVDPRSVRVVTREGDRLFTQRTGGPRFEALPSSENEFFYKGTFNHFTFEKDPGGGVTAMTMYQEGRKVFCPREGSAPGPAPPAAGPAR
jgi:D-alanyl-D-alanine carboxypeptidase